MPLVLRPVVAAGRGGREGTLSLALVCVSCLVRTLTPVDEGGSMGTSSENMLRKALLIGALRCFSTSPSNSRRSFSLMLVAPTVVVITPDVEWLVLLLLLVLLRLVC